MRGEVVLSNFSQIKNVVFAALAAAGAAAAQAFGGWDMALRALLAFMAADYVTGLLVAAVFRRSPKTERGALSSRAGFIGLVKKCDILLLVLLAVMLDRATGSGADGGAVPQVSAGYAGGPEEKRRQWGG